MGGYLSARDQDVDILGDREFLQKFFDALVRVEAAADENDGDGYQATLIHKC